MRATGEFTVSNWDQVDLGGVWDGNPVMKVDAVFEVTGEISGNLLVAYLMHYAEADQDDPHDNTAQYTGFLAFRGKIADREGAFIMQDSGVYENAAPSSALTIVNGSGTGDLADLCGAGKYYARGDKMVIELEVDYADR